MSCILTISGKELDIDVFLSHSTLMPYKKSYKGQPLSPLKPKGKKLERSSIAIEASSADFSEFSKQIEDAINYLQANSAQLKIIAVTKEIEFATLDFGVDLRINNDDILTETHRLPPQLLALAGNLGISIEVSVYSKQMGYILEKRYKKRTRKFPRKASNRKN